MASFGLTYGMRRAVGMPYQASRTPRREKLTWSSKPVLTDTAVKISAAAGDSQPGSEYALTDDQRRSLQYSASALKRWGWASFWIQLALSLTSTGILLFSVAFTASNGPRISLYMVLLSIIASYFSTFWSYGYTRLSRKLVSFSEAMKGTDVTSKGVKKKDVKQTLRNGLTVNVVGMGAALLGLQAMVGMLVAKTLTSASANPFFANTASSQFNPVLAIDVFLVQAATNTLLSHFTSLVICFLLLRAVDR